MYICIYVFILTPLRPWPLQSAATIADRRGLDR